MNMNDYVYVRLNDHGRKIHRDNQHELSKFYPYTPPKEINGWARFQMWELMREFGRHVYNGCVMPFENTEIALTDPNARETDCEHK